MAVFVVVPGQGSEHLGSIIEKEFSTDCLQLRKGAWLVSFDGTSRELCMKLGLDSPKPEGPFLNGVVFAVSAYWGRAPSNVWEWLSVKGL